MNRRDRAAIAGELRELLVEAKDATERFIANERARGAWRDGVDSALPFEIGYLRAGVEVVADRLEEVDRAARVRAAVKAARP